MLIIGLNQSVAWDVLKGEDSVADPSEITHFRRYLSSTRH
jgi:hypothetical protein